MSFRSIQFVNISEISVAGANPDFVGPEACTNFGTPFKEKNTIK